jgi:formate-dependent nitrite reductase membrane component NrfD
VPLQVLVAATADPSGGGALISWFALWPGLAVAAVTATALFLGAADTSAAPRVTLILAAVLATAGATLRASLLASGAPER